MTARQTVTAAVAVLAQAHRQVVTNQYGSYVVAGFAVAEGISGKARITHATPEPDLLDPDRPSDDDMAAHRHRMVDAYAVTLETAGWEVDKHGLTSRRPYLLAARP